MAWWDFFKVFMYSIKGCTAEDKAMIFGGCTEIWCKQNGLRETEFVDLAKLGGE